MALKAGMVGLSAGSSVLTGGPGDALRGRSRSRSPAAVDGLCFAERGPVTGGFTALGPTAPASVQPSINGQFRTGTDKGNPTV